jgi:hypothetical protein
MTLPADVGAESPAPGSTLMVEYHYFNSGSGVLPDSSSVQVCTVAAGKRPNVAAVTWLGTEDLAMPPGMESSFTGSCTPSRRGLDASAPIHLLYTIPHMHQYGRHIAITIQRADGSTAPVLDQAFDDSNQRGVATVADVMPGDRLATTCTFQNTSAQPVGYGGPFDGGEMCYAFVVHYPAHALDNGAMSLLGANNSCL